ncbi:MAG: conjugal transfer protein TraF [Endomicrobium sp.]|jgi:long-subunit fatty acid transport protein|uniref:OmpP1/FadL family transporter n=1 Tax=Candidatus Endomicrobiellum cubanum TaxID=3242325 RepID=UPI00283966A7|nr:conjugal transfer protein TraF [Endomicrobium sp.]
MYELKSLSFLCCLVGIFYQAAIAIDTQERAFLQGVRPMGMGGAFTAICDDENMFFYNPAGITAIQNNRIQIFSLGVSIDEHVTNAYSFYNRHKEDFLNFNDLSSQQQEDFVNEIYDKMLSYHPNVLISLPNIFFIKSPIDVKQNSLSFGLGIFSYAQATLKIDKTSLLPAITYKAEANGIGVLPVAFRISSLERIGLPGELSLGINLKYIYSLVNSHRDLSINEIQGFDFGHNFFNAMGFMTDFGMLYSLNSRWRFGLDVIDIYSSELKYKKANISFGEKKDDEFQQDYITQIDPSLNVGFAYQPEKIYYWFGNYWDSYNKLILVFDLRDITNKQEPLSTTPLKKVHMGVEYKLTRLLALRTGFSSGYPTFGVGLGNSSINFGYAFYGEEKGLLPGDNPSWTHKMIFSIRIS